MFIAALFVITNFKPDPSSENGYTHYNTVKYYLVIKRHTQQYEDWNT